MKTSLFCSLVILLAGATSAQTPEPQVRRVPPVPGAAPRVSPNSTPHNRQGRAKPAMLESAPNPGEALPRNVTLKWKGTFQGTTDVDFEMTGIGPKFSSDFSTKKRDPEDPLPPTIFAINATVTEVEGGYRVDYRIGARIAVPTSTFSRPGGGTSTNIEYRDLMISGTAIVEPGKPLALSKLNEKELTLEIAETE